MERNLILKARSHLLGAVGLLKKPYIALSLSGLLMAVIYAQGFTRPANMLAIDVGQLAGEDYLYLQRPIAQIRLIVSFLMLSGLYAYGLWAANRIEGGLAWTFVFGGAAVFAAILVFMYPFGAADIFDNIIHGRMQAVYGSNPFVAVAADYPEDPFYRYVAWVHQPTAYGPIWELMAAGAVAAAGSGFTANVLTFKLLPGMFWMASGYVLMRMLREYAPEYAVSGALLWLWNPAVLYETWGNGHNDAVIVATILIAAWLLVRAEYAAGMLSLIAGGLVKYIPALLIPAAAFLGLRRLEGWRSRVRYVLAALGAGAAIILLTSFPFWEGWRTLSIGRRLGMFTTSLPAALVQLMIPILGGEAAMRWVSLTAAGLTLGVAIWVGWRRSRGRSWDAFPRAGFEILAFYLLVTCLWFQGWYVLWLVGLAALLPDRNVRLFAVGFSLFVMVKYLVLGPVLLWQLPWPPEPQLELTFTLGVMGIPWLLAAALLLRPRTRDGQGTQDSSLPEG